MQLYEFTTVTNEDGSKLVRASGRVANHPERGEQTEWIEFQFSIDVQTVRNGAALRREVLTQAHEKLFELAKNFERIAYQNM